MHKFFERFSFLKLFIVLSALTSLGLISGCDLLLPAQPLPPTSTGTATALPTPTIDWFPRTPTPTLIAFASPTPLPTREGQMAGLTELLVDDNFTDDSLWSTRQSASGNIAFGNQNLTLAVAQQSTSLFSLSEHILPQNFATELTIQASLCESDDQIGIVFWHQSDTDFYRLLINCAGQYRLELVQGGENFVIHNWESATHMQQGSPATNRFSLWVYRGQFELYINDRFQFEETIVEDGCGALGFFARTISGKALTVRFSDLQVYRVESQ